ncbi:MAG: hypothetical protein ACRD2E_01575 [Terriglobales bacterium]
MAEKIQEQNARGEAHPGYLPGGTSWAKGLALGEFENDAHSMRITRGNLYDLHGEYARARKSGNPLLAPHGGLRSLHYGEQGDLSKFLREFGPLEWNWAGPWGGPDWRGYAQQHQGEEPYADVSVAEFWERQLHFVLIAQLWESWDGPARLHAGFVNLALERERLAPETWSRFIPFLRMAAHLDKIPPYRAAMWDRPGAQAAEKGLDFEKFVAGVRKQNPGWLRHWAGMLIQAELDFQSQGRRAIWAWQGSVGTRVWFQQKLEMNTLWAGIWELLALDFAQPLPWRVCPHCGKLFYPPRKDRFYCTPEQQALASKRNWARTTRSALKSAALGKGMRKGTKRP